ncbi:MAG: TetR family transcriptional regulator [Chloroflexi bacterium]|nr:TetR family transcriptional regulator [Chloroflexota bacterium]
MARTVNKEDYAAKRTEILAAAQRLVLSKGYERMTIQDLLRELGMSNGAFFHYFDSKAAVLAALIEAGQPELEALLLPIVHDPHLTAPEKFRRFFATLDRLRIENQSMIADLANIWFSDENAIVRAKADALLVARRAPLLNAIVRQGTAEGAFTTPFPDQAGVVILAITRGMNNALLKLLIGFEQAPDPLHTIDEIVATAGASAEAIERVLGSSTPLLDRPDANTIKVWLAAAEKNLQERKSGS